MLTLPSASGSLCRARRELEPPSQRALPGAQRRRRLPERRPASRRVIFEGVAYPSGGRIGRKHVLSPDELFRVTPPTALIFDESFLFYAAMNHLARHGILAPDHVSLICSDLDPTFAWCRPTIAHYDWDHRPWVRRAARWVDNVAKGKDDRRQTLTKIEIVEGGTMGPAPGRK